MRLGLMVIATALAASMTQPLSAQNNGVSAADLFAAFEANGLELSEVRSDGSRSAHMELSGETNVNFTIRPVQCTDNQNCKAVMMFANFKVKEVTDQVKARVGNFNDSQFFGRAYYTADKVGIDSVVRVDGPGDIPYLRRRIADYRGTVRAFLNHMRGQ